MQEGVKRFQAQVKQREQARKRQKEALEEALSTAEEERDGYGSALVRKDQQLREGAWQVIDRAHVLLSVRTAAFCTDVLLLIALLSAAGCFANRAIVLSWEGVTVQGVQVPVETLVGGGLLLLMFRCLASPGRWLFGTDLIRVPDAAASGALIPLPERAGWLCRLTSGALHYVLVAVACALANWCPGRAVTWVDLLSGSLGQPTWPRAVQLIAALWTGLLLLTLLLRGLLPLRPSLLRGTTVVESLLRLGYQGLRLDRVTAWRSPPRRPA
jgi:hypothetical protein